MRALGLWTGMLLGLLGLGQLVGGCARAASKQGRAQLVLARSQYEGGKYVPAVRMLSNFIRDERGSKELGQAYYLRGLCYQEMGSGRELEASGDFEAAIKKSRGEAVAGLAHVALGHIYFEKHPDKQDKAIEQYTAALGKLGEVKPKDVVLYRLGVAQQKLGQWSEADLHLSRCLDGFAESKYASYARGRFGSRRWRLQYGAFGNLGGAKRMVRELGRSGVEAEWLPRRKDGRLLYAVQSGEYNTYAEAEAAWELIRGQQGQAEIVAAP